jgi:hypothetical protein
MAVRPIRFPRDPDPYSVEAADRGPDSRAEVYLTLVNARTTLAASLLGAAVAVAAVVDFLATARAATTAVTVRVDVFPDQPRAGEVTTVQLRPFSPLVAGGTPPALVPKNFPWRVAAISPSGRSQRIRMVRKPSDPYLWSGTMRFRSPGSWRLCVLNFSGTGHACVPRSPGWRRVRVQERRAPVDVWHRLQRPLRVPTIADGKPCPTTPPDPNGDLTRIGLAGTAWGKGPAYPEGLDSGRGKPILTYLDPIPPLSGFYGSKWFGNKVLWVIDPVYRGPVLIRGRQLDGPNELRFDRGLVPPREMQIRPRPAPRGQPSFTRVRGPGCYGYQADGVDFSYVIVFEAQPF